MMFPFSLSVDVVDHALEMAKEHVEHYYSYRDYDEVAFTNRISFSPDSIVEVTRKQLLKSRGTALRASGIYLIVHENGETVYVGLASDFHSRFTKGVRKHSEKCKPGCGHWGHFADPTTGAVMVGMPDGECRYFILENIDYDGFGISQAEIDWYYIFVANGWSTERKSALETKKLTNQRGALGSKGNEVSPCIIFYLETNQFYYFVSTQDASDYFGVPNGVLFGRQRQNSGFVRRNATENEISTNPPTIVGDREVTWTDNQGNPIKDDEINRNSLLNWTAGRLSLSDIDAIRKFTRGSYDKSNATDYIWVYWDSHYERHYWKAYKREFRNDGVKRREKMEKENKNGDDFTSPREAAIERENWIIKKNLTDINASNFDWKPPKE